MTDPDGNFDLIMKDGVIYKNTLLRKMITPVQHRKIKELIPHMYGEYNYID